MRETYKGMEDRITALGCPILDRAPCAIRFDYKGTLVTAVSGIRAFVKPGQDIATRWKLTVPRDRSELRFHTFSTLDCYAEGLYSPRDLQAFSYPWKASR